MTAAIPATDEEQIAAVVGIVRDVLGDNVLGIYLHGSTGTGRTRPTSDLDILVVIRDPTTVDQRRALVTRIPAVSGSPEPRGRWRPVELNVVRQAAVNPWRYPPERELQYGQWDRARYLAGFVPGPEPEPDLAVLITAALAADRAVVGPSPAALLAPVPPQDLRRSVVAGVPGLLADLEPDTRNVLLTLARIWFTVATGEIRSKDEAATWAIERGSPEVREVLALARSQYESGTHGDPEWARRLPAVRAAAQSMVDEIDLALRD